MSNVIDYEINKELGECYLFMGEYEKAKDYYEKASSSDATKADPYMGLAAIALNAGDITTAYAHYTKANDLGETDKTLAGIGMVELELGKHEDAFRHFKASLALNPVNMVSINSIVQLAYFLKRLPDVVPLLEQALQASPEGLDSVRYALAGCLTSLGENEKAKSHLEILLGSNPANDQAKQLYAHVAA